jgi:hypothetical protein
MRGRRRRHPPGERQTLDPLYMENEEREGPFDERIPAMAVTCARKHCPPERGPVVDVKPVNRVPDAPASGNSHPLRHRDLSEEQWSVDRHQAGCGDGDEPRPSYPPG